MAEHSHIEWTDATWNPITGCSVVSPGCTNCYAMRLAGGRLRNHPSRAGLTEPSRAGPVWNGMVRLNEEWLTQPLAWKRPRRIFVCAHGDLFHESVPDAWIDRVFAVMALAPQHQFQVLTKRAWRMRRYMRPRDQRRADAWGEAVVKLGYRGPLEALSVEHVWLGVSAEDQLRANERVPHLLKTPAAVRFLSAEPLLGRINLRSLDFDWDRWDALGGVGRSWGRAGPAIEYPVGRLDWVIAGGESGPGARPMHPDWARLIRDDCAAAGVPFFFKQWGSWLPSLAWDEDGRELVCMDIEGTRYAAEVKGQPADNPYWTAWWFKRMTKHEAGRELDGRVHDAMPRLERVSPAAAHA